MEALRTLLSFYQGCATGSYKKKYLYEDLAYINNNMNCIFGIMHAMAYVVKYSEDKKDTEMDIMLGDAMFYLANYCQNNHLKMWEICTSASYNALLAETANYMFEDFVEMHRKEITLEADMEEKYKVLFVKKIFLGIFPNVPYDYIQLILNMSISTL